MSYETTIGLEVHVQLKTASKMFCGCATGVGAPPNSQVCPVCLGYPGAMPVMNERAIELTVRSGLMLGCAISEYSKFDRKSYFYPDMPKNYQISQFDRPLCLGGAVAYEIDGVPHEAGITRIHLEEDVGKSTHGVRASGVDFNRAGIPLMEIVGEPDLHSPDQAFQFLHALHQILLYTEVSDCNLELGNMRCDVNISVRPEGQAELGTKAEIKNMNTFKGVHAAITYEVARQIGVLESGGRVIQETRRWDPDAGETSSMRTKEDAHDYRYFPEPDLMPVALPRERVEGWRGALPELPADRRARFVSEYGLPAYDAGVLVADKEVAGFFERAAQGSTQPKAISNWIMTELLRLVGETGQSVGAIPLTPEALAELVELVAARTINMPTAKELFVELFEKGGMPAALVEARGLGQVSDSGAVADLVDEAIAANPKSVDDFKAGKKAAAKFLVGQVMKLSRGKADPQLAGKIIAEKLSSSA